MKRPVLESNKGRLYPLTDGPQAGVKLRLGQCEPHVKGTTGRLVPLPDEIPYPPHGTYAKHVTDTGDVTYRWKRTTPTTAAASESPSTTTPAATTRST